MTTISSREFNQDTAGAKKAAEGGPVFITDRGRPAHVLLTYADFESLAGAREMFALLGQPPGVADIDFEVPRSREIPVPPTFT